MSEWYELPEKRYNKTTSIKPWEPGDGISCSHRNSRSHAPCTPPVAVIRTTEPPSASTRYSFGGTRKRVVCRNHLARMFSDSSIGAEAERRAREAVLVAHWDEYQEQIKRQRVIASEEQFAGIPESLRDAMGVASTLR